MRKDSRKRYSTTENFTFADGAPVLFRGLMPRNVTRKTAYVEHELRVGDRLDSLAESFYGDPRLWWVIAQANPDFLFPADLIYKAVGDDNNTPEFRAGKIIIIPAKPEGPE
jgi:nucleoid-associated protein YgaU